MSVQVKNGYLFQDAEFKPVSTNMDYPLNSEDERYYDIFGIMTGKKYRDYDAAQRQQIYNDYVSKYNANALTPCTDLEKMQSMLENEVKIHTQKMASNCNGGCQRIESRYKDMANKRLNDINNLIAASNCTAQDQAAQNAQVLNAAQQILQTPTTGATGNTGTGLSGIGTSISKALGLSGTSQAPNTQSNVQPGATVPNKSNKLLLYGGIAVGAIVVIVILKKVI